jgi:GH24 family phage-related lysozyme (muramidase)
VLKNHLPPDIDPTGNPTVGYGHLCHKKGCTDVPYHFPLSNANAEALLRDDLKVRPLVISTLITPKLTI